MEVKMNAKWIVTAAALALVMTGCATKKGFEIPGYAFGCPIGETKVSSMDDLVKAKVVSEGRRSTVQATEVRCAKTGDLLKIDANLNNDSKSVKRVSYKFRWIDREGMRAWEEESWKPVMLYDNSNLMVNTVSPTTKAVDFRLILRSDE
jgi:uncharacterized protein YcfL